MNVMEVVEMPLNIANRLVDLLVGVRVGVVWQLIGVNDVVALKPLWR